MGSFKIDVEVDDKGARESILGAVSNVSNFRPLFQAFAYQDWPKRGMALYRSLGGSEAARWPTYNEGDEKLHKFAQKKGHILNRIPQTIRDILRWRGGRERLHPSLTRPRHPNKIVRYAAQWLEIGTNAPGAGNHERGTGHAPQWAGGYPIPRRRLVKAGPYTMKLLVLRVGAFAAEVARKFGKTRAGFKTTDVLPHLGGR